MSLCFGLGLSNKLQPPDRPERSPAATDMVRRLQWQLRQDFPGANMDYFDADFLASVASKPGIETFAALCL